jgi:hypothetical protein
MNDQKIVPVGLKVALAIIQQEGGNGRPELMKA